MMIENINDILVNFSSEEIEKIALKIGNRFSEKTPKKIGDYRNKKGQEAEKLAKIYTVRLEVFNDKEKLPNEGFIETLNSFKSQKGEITSMYFDYGSEGIVSIWFDKEGRVTGCLV